MIPMSTSKLHTPTTVREREGGKIPTTAVTNELARAIMASQPVLGTGNNQPGYRSGEPFIGLIWDEGPDSEADFTDHRYWVRRAFVDNVTSGGVESKVRFQEAPNVIDEFGGSGSGAMSSPDWFAATNLAERPRATGGTESTNGSHHHRKGMAVICWPVLDQDGAVMYVFDNSPKMFMVKITGAITSSGDDYGRYTGKIIKSAPDLASSGPLVEADLGEIPGGDDCVVWLLSDVGQSAHGLTTFPAYGIGHPIGIASSGGTLLAVSSAESSGHLFRVNLELYGGDDGDGTTRATYTYVVSTVDGVELDVGVPVEKVRILPGHVTEATKGIAYFNSDGDIVLWDTNEFWGASVCSEGSA
jgi:hypothetical protein